MANGVSKRTVAVLVLLTVVLSVIGAWNVLTSDTMFTGSAVGQHTVEGSKVQFGLTGPPQNQAEGKVQFGIKKEA